MTALFHCEMTFGQALLRVPLLVGRPYSEAQMAI